MFSRNASANFTSIRQQFPRAQGIRPWRPLIADLGKKWSRWNFHGRLFWISNLYLCTDSRHVTRKKMRFLVQEQPVLVNISFLCNDNIVVSLSSSFCFIISLFAQGGYLARRTSSHARTLSYSGTRDSEYVSCTVPVPEE